MDRTIEGEAVATAQDEIEGLTRSIWPTIPSDEPIPNTVALIECLQRDTGRSVPIDVLCSALWPDRPWQASVHRLRQLVHAARKTLPPDAISTTPGYGYAWTGKPPAPSPASLR